MVVRYLLVSNNAAALPCTCMCHENATMLLCNITKMGVIMQQKFAFLPEAFPCKRGLRGEKLCSAAAEDG